MTTTDMSLRINPKVINDADHGTGRELLCITESAVDALSLNRSRSGLNRNQKSDSSFVNVQARSTDDTESLSADSQSSTASEILRRSTHASAAFSVPASVAFQPCSAENSRLVRIPVRVLREVPLPHDDSVANSHNNFKAHPLSERKHGRLVSASHSISDEAAGRKLDKKALQENEKLHFDSGELSADSAIISRKPFASEVQTADRAVQSELSQSSHVHPLMAMLDGGYLTQPIHAIVAEERPSSGDSHSTSMGASASPIEVLAKDKQTSGFLFFLGVSRNIMLCNETF